MNKIARQQQMRIVRAAKKPRIAKIGKAYTSQQSAGRRGGTSSSNNRTMRRLGMG